ncbi:MAG: sigma-70 family RNA polymerase sigma factor [Actinobacteria bacterium]|nr:sigma-70 family RNA polymerase sigma factor [Actinomycetota bacterium]
MSPLNNNAYAAGAQQSRIDLTVDADQHAGLVRSVRNQVPGISREDAEDAVQEAWIVLAEKADRLEPGPIGGYLRGTARNKAMKIRDKGRRTTSLEALAEAAGEGSRALIDPMSGSLQSHAELDELIDDPVARRAVEAAELGAAPCVAPRGMNHRAARYTDRQVEEVRALRRQGHTFREIEARTGVPAGYGPTLARRECRVTHSSEGWTRQLVLDCLLRFQKKFGRAPVYRDAEGNLAMPSPNTVKRLFGSWRDAVRAAGLDPAYGDRRVTPWTDGEMILAFCGWRLTHGRWPNREDMVADPALPSPATTRRRFGTQSPNRLMLRVLGRLG